MRPMRQRGLRHPLTLLILVVLLAAGVRLLTFQRYLPYNDHIDEPNMLLMGRHWIGIAEDEKVTTWLAGYPPMYAWFTGVFQVVVDRLNPRPWIEYPTYYYWLRFISAMAGLVTLSVIMRLAWRLGGWVAAWFAGIAWAFSPIVIEHSAFAIPDPFVYLACAVTLLCTVEAYLTDSFRWAFGGLVAGICAVYLKYPAVAVLVPWVLTTAWLVWRRRAKLPWRWLLAMLVLITISVAYLVIGHHATELNNIEGDQLKKSGFQTALDFTRQWHNWRHAIWPIGEGVFFAGLLVGAAAITYRWRRSRIRPDWKPAALLIVFGIVGITAVSAYNDLGATPPVIPEDITYINVRHVLPITAGLVVLWAVSLAQGYKMLVETNHARVASRLTITVSVLLLVTLSVNDAGLIQRLNVPNTRYLLQRYSDDNIPQDGLILVSRTDTEKIWNPRWGGYNGVKSFEWWYVDTDILDKEPASLMRDRKLAFLSVSERDLKAPPLNNSTTTAFLDKAILLKTITATAQNFGPTLYFYMLKPPKVTTNTLFGDQISMVGYDLEKTTFIPGEKVVFRPYWRATKPPATNYSMFIHLYSVEQGNRPLAQFDGTPASPVRLTLTWTDSHELIIGRDATLQLPPDLVPGPYQLAIGLYDYTTGVRLKLSSGEDSIRLPIVIN